MNPRYLTAPLVVLALDVVPNAVQDTLSTSEIIRLTGGIATGSYEYKTFDCNGGLTSANPVDVTSGGGRIDVLGEKWRASACAGVISEDQKPQFDSAEDFDGPFIGGQVAAEWKYFGLGGGGVDVGGRDGFTVPSFYLRGGNADRLHVRIDLFPPSECLGNTPWCRLGFGHNLGRAPGQRVLIGTGLFPFTYADQLEPRLFADYAHPLGPIVELQLHSQVGQGAEMTQWSLGAGLTIVSGKGGGR